MPSRLMPTTSGPTSASVSACSSRRVPFETTLNRMPSCLTHLATDSKSSLRSGSPPIKHTSLHLTEASISHRPKASSVLSSFDLDLPADDPQWEHRRLHSRVNSHTAQSSEYASAMSELAPFLMSTSRRRNMLRSCMGCRQGRALPRFRLRSQRMWRSMQSCAHHVLCQSQFLARSLLQQEKWHMDTMTRAHRRSAPMQTPAQMPPPLTWPQSMVEKGSPLFSAS